MKIEKSTAERVLLAALATGGDFAEIFAEDTLTGTIRMIDDKIDVASTGKLHGAGIRVLKGVNCVYATTNDLTEKGLLACAQKAAAALDGKEVPKSIQWIDRTYPNRHPVDLFPSSVDFKRKADLVKEGYYALKNYSPEIVQASASLVERDQSVFIANSNGVYATDRRVYSRIPLMAIASDGMENQMGFEGPGMLKGFETFGADIDVKEKATTAAEQAITMLHAKNCPAGIMPVAIENGFGGVLFHEACGHSLEATAVSKGNSEFTGRLGEKIASSKVTAIDDGTMLSEWGSLNIDDEGTPTQRNVLIDQGVLKGYLVDILGGRRMHMTPTGSSRRESYQYMPTSRMNNTYIANGTDDNAEIISSMEDGLYAKKMGGGSVNPLTGEFNFAVAEGYLVKNGEITEPVRGASLIGKGSQILLDIDRVGQNLDHGVGMCGSISGSVPVTVGQPLIRVSQITVGGRQED